MPCYSLLNKTNLKSMSAIVEAAKALGLSVNFSSELLINISTKNGEISLERDSKKENYGTSYTGSDIGYITRQYTAQKLKHWASANKYKISESTEEVQT